MSHEITPTKTYAAIDLGSNSFHMAVAGVSQAHLQMIDKLRKPIRLGAGLDADNNIEPATMARSLECLAMFQQRLRGVPAEQIRAVGTNTMRRAQNARIFNKAAEEILGVPIEIISGREEARLIFSGVTYGIHDNKKRLVIDIGGGSTEIIAGTATSPLLMESTDMGCVSATRQWFQKNTNLPRQFDNAVSQCQLETQSIKGKYLEHGWDHCVGSSGTIKATERILIALGLSDRGIPAASLEKLIKQISKKGIGVISDAGSVSDDRVAVILGGLAVLLATFRSLNIEFMSVSHSALREGVIVDLVAGQHSEHVRQNAISDLHRRFQIDVDQASRVSATSALLFSEARKPWGFGKKHDLANLMWASQLHEIGLSVSRAQYHKHGDYLLRSADILGFSRKDQAMLASLVRNHRRQINLDVTAGLGSDDQLKYPYLLALLRLSVLLHRTRGADSMPPLNVVQFDHKSIRLKLPKAWITNHPLTVTDLHAEIESLGSIGIKLKL